MEPLILRQVLESSRPTMTRMAIGSVLPGSALIVGLAAPKKQTNDTRTAKFIVVHPRWRIVEDLDPNHALSFRGIAAQINAIADSLNRQTFEPIRPLATAEIHVEKGSPMSRGVNDQLDKLERVDRMVASGALTEDQAMKLRGLVLGSLA